MAQISRYFFLRHLRAEPNQAILHFRRGKLARSGAGLSYWFHPLSAAVQQIPVEDIATTFMLRERSADLQEVAVQVTLSYRVDDAQKAGRRINFTISISSGAWVEQPLERLAGLWSRWAQEPVRATLAALPLAEAVRTGATAIRNVLDPTLRANPEAADIGLALVSVQVDQVVPNAEIEKALQTPTREAIQQKADQATFERRAMAVEKERAIKENELATEIELARRQEDLIRQQAANRMLSVRQDAEAQKLGVEAQAERDQIAAEAAGRDAKIRAAGDAEAQRLLAETQLGSEARRAEIWSGAPPSVLLGFALQEFAGKIQSIEHLNLTPDLLGDLLQRFALKKAGD
mgnify:CR=1